MPAVKRAIRDVVFSSQFDRKFGALQEKIKRVAWKKDRMFRIDAFHPLLRTHKLGGEFKDYWAYSVNQRYRVLFYFIDDHTVAYINIGTHEIYK